MTVNILNEQYEVGSRLLVTTRGTKPPTRDLHHEGELLGWYTHPLSHSSYLQLKGAQGQTISILSVSIHDVDVLSYRNIPTKRSSPGRIPARPVIETTTNQKFKSVQDACRKTGCSPSGVIKVLRGEQESTKGLIFRYVA